MSDHSHYNKPRLSLPPGRQERRPFKPHPPKPKKEAPGPMGHQKLLADAVASGEKVMIEFTDGGNVETKLLGADAFSITYEYEGKVVVVFKHSIQALSFYAKGVLA